MNRCRCQVGVCVRCICAREGLLCDENCLCFPERCTNRGVEDFRDAEEEAEAVPVAMDPNMINAALAALLANQQQHQADQQQLQQQLQLQQDVMTALANRLLAAPAPAPVVVPAPAPAVPVAPVRAVLDPEVKFSGCVTESVTDWLQLVNRKALAENWGDDVKRRAAISTLFGKALTWQEEIGVNLLQWNDWIAGLRGAFEVQLTEGQWQALVEGRKQQPNETGSAYVLDKVKLCRRRSVPLTDVEMVPFLIRGLHRPEMRSVMMGNPPISVNDFLIKVRRLENIADPVAGPVKEVTEKEDEKKTANDSLFQAVEALTNQVAVLTLSVIRPASPGQERSTPKQVTFDRRPPGSRNEVQCYNCRDYGHISRDCPRPNPRWNPKRPENESADPSGQSRQ